MMAMGGMELIFILGLLAGGGSLDIASSLPAKEYFKARDIEVSADKLMELAGQDPDTGKKQIGQLIALGHLAKEPDLLKKSDKLAQHRRLLGEIAQGKKANDPNGFSVSYAERVLLALDGQKPLPGAKRSWKEVAKFLPENASLIGLVDLASSQSPDRKLPDFGMLFEFLPQPDREAFWSTVEKLGNIQVDSFGFSLTNDAGDGKITEMVFRVTGRGNPDWLASVMTGVKEDKSKDHVGPNGEKMRVFTGDHDGPAIVILGSTEVLIGGYPPEFNRGGANPAKKNHQEVLDRLLAQRAKAPLGPLQGRLKADLAKVPADANGFVVGAPIKDKGVAPFPMPNRVLAHAKRIAGGIDLQAQGAMADEKDAKSLIDTIAKGRDQGLQELNRLQGKPLPIPGINVGVMIGMLENMQLQAKGSEAQLRILIPDEAMMTLPIAFALPLRAVAAPPVKIEVKEEAKKVEEKK
jgi:hypothetical protein